MAPVKTVEQKRKAVGNKITKLKKQPNQSKAEVERLEALLAKGDEDLDRESLGDIDMQDDETPDAGHSQTGGNEQSSGNNSDAPQADPPRADSPPAAGSAQSGGGEQSSAGETVAGRTDESTPDQRQRRQAEGSNSQSSEPSVKSEPDDDTSPLFVGESESKLDLENDAEEPLFASPSHSLGKDVRTVAWNSQSGTYINGYGKKGCSRYRLDDNCTAGYKKDDSEDFYKNSLGDKQEHRKWKYTKDHFSGQIWGVAWEGDGSENDLDLIDPDQAGRRKGKDGNGTGAAWPRTYVLVLWDVNNQKSKRWETRSTVRRLWGNKKADKAIFEAACQAEERYIAATQGKRGYTRSPSAALRRRTKSPSPSRSRSRSTSSTPARTSRWSASNDKAVSEESLEDFKTDYFELAGVEAFAELSMEDKMECMKMWKVKKSGLRSRL
jgi:hypothetical protein